jgi:hypothetical protein
LRLKLNSRARFCHAHQFWVRVWRSCGQSLSPAALSVPAHHESSHLLHAASISPGSLVSRTVCLRTGTPYWACDGFVMVPTAFSPDAHLDAADSPRAIFRKSSPYHGSAILFTPFAPSFARSMCARKRCLSKGISAAFTIAFATAVTSASGAAVRCAALHCFLAQCRGRSAGIFPKKDGRGRWERMRGL